MRRRELVITLCACACAGGAAPESSPALTFVDPDLGVALDLPVDWHHDGRGAGHVFSGRPGTDAYFTTVTVQPLARLDSEPLETALARAYAPLASAPSFAWELREPTTADGRPALFYTVRFEHHERMRRKACLLVDARRRHFIDLCYAATEELFPGGVPIFEEALRTLTF